jgi:transcriptional regulator with XRE-family HTH domain
MQSTGVDQGQKSGSRVPAQRSSGAQQLRARKVSKARLRENMLLRVRNEEWPVEEFNRYLTVHRDKVGFANDAALARAADLNASLISNWRNGKAQPSRQSLNKLAPVLKVSRMNLWIVAGIAEDDDHASPPTEFDDAPAVVLDLLALYRDPRMTEDDRTSLRKWLSYQIAGVRSELGARTVPTDRRSA